MSQIEELRQQFLGLLIDAGFAPPASKESHLQTKSRIRFQPVPAAVNKLAEDPQLVMNCVAAGMYPKLLTVDSSGHFRTLVNNAPAAIHPSSVNFGAGRRPDFGDVRFITYFNIMHSKKLCASQIQ